MDHSTSVPSAVNGWTPTTTSTWAPNPMANAAPANWTPPVGPKPTARRAATVWVAVLAAATLLLVAVALTGVLLLDEESLPTNDNFPVGVTSTGGPPPAGPGEDWTLAFSEDFNGDSLDPAKWTDRSSAEADEGHGNKDNKQLEWNHAANCAVRDGELVLTAKRDQIVSGSGERYDWSSCLISSSPSYAFQYAYIEERAILPTARGFWPAFWTWQAPGVEQNLETDVYEFYSSDPGHLVLTQHSGERGSCRWRLPFNPGADWHVYAAAIEPSGTTWYVDGIEICRSPATSTGMANLVSNLAVDAENPPAGGTTTAVKRVDYIRAWQRR